MERYLTPGDASVDLLVIRDLISAAFLVLVSALEEFFNLLLPFNVAAIEVVETALDEQFIEVHLEACLLEDSLFDGSICDESQDNHLLLLADSVGSVLCLQIHLGVPVGVEQDHSVCCLQVETQASCSGTQEEDVVFRVLLVEEGSSLTSIVGLGTTVQPQVLNALIVEVDLHDVHEMGHLCENEDSVSELFQLWQNAVNELELA